MTTVLVTRPRLVSETLCRRLNNAGYTILSEPVLVIEALDNSLPVLSTSPIIVLTSRITLSVLSTSCNNAAMLSDFTHCPCYCVGEQTASEARAFGFKNVISADGDGERLAHLITQTEAHKSPVLHIGGVDVSLQPSALLSDAGWTIIHWPVYRARAVERFSSPVREKFEKGEIGAVVLASVRTAQIFTRLILDSKLESCCANLIAVGLSRAVVDALEPLPVGQKLCAQDPTEAGLVNILSHFTV